MFLTSGCVAACNTTIEVSHCGKWEEQIYFNLVQVLNLKFQNTQTNKLIEPYIPIPSASRKQNTPSTQKLYFES